MTTQIQDLQLFIDKAVRNYKYTSATGSNLRNAVGVITTVLQEDEKNSVELIQQRADDIINRIDIKEPNKYSASSLMTYKSRLLRVIGDYLHYGQDASKMAGWSPKVSKKASSAPAKKQKTHAPKAGTMIIEAEEVQPRQTAEEPLVLSASQVLGTKMQSLDLPLKDERSVVIYYPIDLSVKEAEKITAVLTGIAALTES